LAVFDKRQHGVVLGIVYDGPPEAGKTTSVRALAQGFGREIFTPEEQEGRTVYFDWLEHTGGRFDGGPIRCQIMSVPGQERWLSRRLQILDRADVVVLVGDTSASGWPATVARLRDLRMRLDARPGPPVGVVFQANRRDAADAVDLDEVQRQVSSERVAVIESIAVDGTGVRETFVFAVRLALDRVREEQRLGELSVDGVEFDAHDLLEQMQALEPALEGVVSSVSPEPEQPKVTVSAREAPRSESVERDSVRVPTADVPSGLVWPPVEGRILLRHAMNDHPRISQDDSGDHVANLGTGFRLRSTADAAFQDLDDGRAALVAWARLHVSAHALLSKQRCVVLTAAPDRGFRLWQIVRVEPSVRELLIGGWEYLAPKIVARQLAAVCRLLADALALCKREGLEFDCTLDTIGISELGRPHYVGDAPASFESNPVQDRVARIANELTSLIEQRGERDRLELRNEFQQLQRREYGLSEHAEISAHVSALLDASPEGPS
jgi:signal recognition particle receptor subunit beta